MEKDELEPPSYHESAAATQPIEQLSFDGTAGEDVTFFLRGVTRAAFAQGHGSDNSWIAQYVETCLGGEALRWFSSLDEDTRSDFGKLREAMLKRFDLAAGASIPGILVQASSSLMSFFRPARASQSSSPQSAHRRSLTPDGTPSRSTIDGAHSAASASLFDNPSPSFPLDRKTATDLPSVGSFATSKLGRIKVIRPVDGHVIGYCSRDDLDRFHLWRSLVTDASEALVVERCPPKRSGHLGTIDLKIHATVSLRDGRGGREGDLLPSCHTEQDQEDLTLRLTYQSSAAGQGGFLGVVQNDDRSTISWTLTKCNQGMVIELRTTILPTLIGTVLDVLSFVRPSLRTYKPSKGG